jgi:hypothetical protein
MFPKTIFGGYLQQLNPVNIYMGVILQSRHANHQLPSKNTRISQFGKTNGLSGQSQNIR